MVGKQIRTGPKKTLQVKKNTRIGILALQGDYREHIHVLQKLKVTSAEVRLPQDLEGLSGLIIPGGESTTIAKLAVMYNLMEPLRRFAKRHAIWGTCAGMIFMAKQVDTDQPLLGLMDIVVHRNAFGRQVDSFTTDLEISVFKDETSGPFPAVFIRAPKLVAVKGAAKIIATLPDGTAVAAQEGKLLVTAFHPELTGDMRLHRYFTQLACAS